MLLMAFGRNQGLIYLAEKKVEVISHRITAAYIRRCNAKLLEILIDDPDFEWQMIDTSHCKAHPHVAGTREAIKDMNRTKGAQHKTVSGCGCAWYTAQGSCCTGTRYAPDLASLPHKILPIMKAFELENSLRIFNTHCRTAGLNQLSARFTIELMSC